MIPKYIKCIKTGNNEYTVGRIYETIAKGVKTNKGYLGNRPLPSDLLNHYDCHNFTPSTEQEWLLQEDKLIVNKTLFKI